MHFDFEHEMQKKISSKYEEIYDLSKQIGLKLDDEKPDWLIEEFTRKLMDIISDIMCSVLNNYHVELMDYIHSEFKASE